MKYNEPLLIKLDPIDYCVFEEMLDYFERVLHGVAR